MKARARDLGALVCCMIVLGESASATFGQATSSSTAIAPPAGPIDVVSFQPDTPLVRAERAVNLVASLKNTTSAPLQVEATLFPPEQVLVVGATPDASLSVPKTFQLAIDPGRQQTVSWPILAKIPGEQKFPIQVTLGAQPLAESSLTLDFLPPVAERKLAYVPPPQPAPTKLLIGALDCPLWERLTPAELAKLHRPLAPGETVGYPWSAVVPHPERTPALGFYDQRNPEVADWEIKWALDHGISYFVYCWYRQGKSVPIQMKFGGAIHDGLFKSRYGDQFKFAIMWTNVGKEEMGIKDEHDLLQNLFPFWIKNYFQRGNYLKIDNKPLLFVYTPNILIKQLGGVAGVRHAFDAMRAQARAAGFDGLYLLGEYRGQDARELALMKQLGLDYTFAYCWNILGSPAPADAIATQMKWIRNTEAIHILPEVVTVSQGWSGWHDEGSIWKLPPDDWRSLLVQARDYVATLPPHELGSKMLLLDDWNEFGEGHYIAPHREYGFGYLDAVRSVFSTAPEPPDNIDLLPQDIGLGPYDQPPPGAGPP
jgi:hypothetical protein